MSTVSSTVRPLGRPVKRGRGLLIAIVVIIALVAPLGAVFLWRPLWVIDQGARAWLRVMGVRSEYVQPGKYRIHYLTGGRGRPLVLVHGLGGKSENWAQVMPTFMRQGYQVWAIDLLGFGRSDRPDVDYSIPQQADILNQFFESQHLAQADLVGWSMGGWVALKFTLAHPERVRRIVVYDSAGINFKPNFDPALFHPATVKEARQFLALLSPRAWQIPRFVARDMIRETRRSAWVVDRAMKSMQSGADVLDGRLSAIQVPVLIIWGKEDILVPTWCGEEMHREMPQSILTFVDGCGHLAPVECADKVMPETIRFLAAKQPLPAAVREIPR